MEILYWPNSFFDDDCGDLSKLGQKSQKFDFQNQFSMSKNSLICLVFSSSFDNVILL